MLMHLSLSGSHFELCCIELKVRVFLAEVGWLGSSPLGEGGVKAQVSSLGPIASCFTFSFLAKPEKNT